jgi:DNA invertase Pin-like site-specific DNA recombinase
MKRIALYARVSTTDQRPEVQLNALREYAAARRLDVAREYVDHGVSGTRDRRPALDALLADAKRRRFDGVAAVKLDRLARSVRHLTAMCADWDALGVDLIGVAQPLDQLLAVHHVAVVRDHVLSSPVADDISGSGEESTDLSVEGNSEPFCAA